jgi:hypothetical protein
VKDLRLDVDTLHLARRSGAKIVLTFRALAYGFDEELKREIPDVPIRETGVLRDERGRIVRDPDTGQMVRTTNQGDPGYKAAQARVNRLQSIYMIVRALAPDSGVTFEADRKACKDTADYCERIEQEITAAGFSLGDVAQMLAFVLQLSNLSKEKVEAARESFLSET